MLHANPASIGWSTCRVIHADRFVNVPHFAVKSGAERMLETMGFSATILRPSYFIDNEVKIKDVILNHGVVSDADRQQGHRHG